MRRLPTVLLFGGLTAIPAGRVALMPVGSHVQRWTDWRGAACPVLTLKA